MNVRVPSQHWLGVVGILLVAAAFHRLWRGWYIIRRGQGGSCAKRERLPVLHLGQRWGLHTCGVKSDNSVVC